MGLQLRAGVITICLMSQFLRVAAVQLNSQDDVPANLAECCSLIGRAAEQGAQLVLLPENFAFMGDETERRRLAERLGDLNAPIQSALSAAAAEHRVTLVAGGFPELSADEARPYNTLLVIHPDGSLGTSYRKIHLFDVDLPDGTRLCESASTEPGQRPQVAEVAGFKLGLSICYDLRFPELYRALVDLGAEVLLVPAAFTLHTGKDHWHVLLRARAIEAQSWVVAAAQWGRHPRGRASYGHAMVVDPWGVVVAECSDGVGVVCANIDRSLLGRVRLALPALSHRRLDLEK
jgi:predicted amidohydrolase